MARGDGGFSEQFRAAVADWVRRQEETAPVRDDDWRERVGRQLGRMGATSAPEGGTEAKEFQRW